MDEEQGPEDGKSERRKEVNDASYQLPETSMDEEQSPEVGKTGRSGMLKRQKQYAIELIQAIKENE